MDVELYLRLLRERAGELLAQDSGRCIRYRWPWPGRWRSICRVPRAGHGAGRLSYGFTAAAAMRYRRPIQIIRRSAWDPSFTPPGGDKPRLQDLAARAWNLHTALYYKAGGVPWRLPRETTDLDSCYVGITFYRSGDHTTLDTSVAQVFNERGDGVIVRGAPAKVSHHDKQPHLTENDAHALLCDALGRYRKNTVTSPPVSCCTRPPPTRRRKSTDSAQPPTPPTSTPPN
jgi:hypothetical protein